MQITRVEVKKLEEPTGNRIKGLATITIDDCFVIHNIRIIEKYDKKEGHFVAMPSKKNKYGKYEDHCHPIKEETRREITKAILDEFYKN